MIKRLIFDVDGTLITGVNFREYVKKALEKIDIYTEENVDKFLKAMKTYETKFNNYNQNDYLNHIGKGINQKLPDDFLKIFFEELKVAIPPLNEELIQEIKELSEKYELAILTNYFSESQLNRLNNMEIGKFFTEIHGEKLIKPNINAYLNACGKNEKIHKCVVC